MQWLDGHDISALLRAFAEAGSTKGKPAVILAETLKGKGIDGYEEHHFAIGGAAARS